MEWKGTRMALIAVLAAVSQMSSAEAQSLTSPNSSSVPMFAGVKGDGTSVGFSWWVVKGATSYELVRTRVGEDLSYAHLDLSDELYLVNREMRDGYSWDEALCTLSERTGVGDRGQNKKH